jgi:hypothetical protein
MLARITFVPLVLSIAACGDASSAPSSAHAPANVPATPGNVAGLAVRAEPEANGAVVPVVEARGDAPVRVKRAVTVERRNGSSWVSAGVQAVTLRPSCEAEADACITLVRGAGLRPPAWNGKAGAGQCAPGNTDAPPGEYRFTLESCEGEARVASPAFEVRRR